MVVSSRHRAVYGPQGFTDVLGDRWSGLSGALGASNGSYGPHDLHNCNIGVVRFNLKITAAQLDSHMWCSSVMNSMEGIGCELV